MTENNDRIDVMLRQAIEIIEKLMVIKEEGQTIDNNLPLPDDLCTLICDLADNAYRYRNATPEPSEESEIQKTSDIHEISEIAEVSEVSEISENAEESEDSENSENSEKTEILDNSEISDSTDPSPIPEVEISPLPAIDVEAILQNLSVNEVFLYGRYFGGGKKGIRNYILESGNMSEEQIEEDLESRGLLLDTPEGERFFNLLTANR